MTWPCKRTDEKTQVKMMLKWSSTVTFQCMTQTECCREMTREFKIYADKGLYWIQIKRFVFYSLMSSAVSFNSLIWSIFWVYTALEAGWGGVNVNNYTTIPPTHVVHPSHCCQRAGSSVSLWNYTFVLSPLWDCLSPWDNGLAMVPGFAF